MAVIRSMAETGLKASASDAGVGALCARTAVRGAYLNVKINASQLEDALARAKEAAAQGRPVLINAHIGKTEFSKG